MRNETVIQGKNYNSGLTPIITEGEKAAKGQTIFRYSSLEEEETKQKIEEVNQKIEEALANQPKIFQADIKNLEKQVDEKVKQIQKLTDLHTISEYKKEIEEIINKKAKIAGSLSQSGSYIQELTKQKEKYEKQLTESSEYVVSPMSGVISYRVDGLEDVLKASDFSNLTEESLERLDLKTGKIISSSEEKR